MLNSAYKTPEKPKFEALPEDMYQVVIEDINLDERDNWNNPNEKEEVLKFKYRVVEEGEYNNRVIFQEVRPIMSAGSDKGQASWLYEIYKAAMKQEPTKDQLAEGLSANEINNLIAKQIRLSIKSKLSQKGNLYNKVDGVLFAKQELPIGKLEMKRPVESEEETERAQKLAEANEIFGEHGEPIK